MKSNKIFSVMLVLLFISSISLFANGTTEKNKTREELVIWVEKSFSDTANTSIENRIKQFSVETGVNIKYEFISAVDFMTKLNAAIEAGNVPDITTGAPHKVLSYYPNNPYYDVTDIVNQIDIKRPIFISMKDGTKVAGKNYFVPYTSSSAMLFLRKDIFDAKAVRYPSTWDELFEAAKKVSDPAKGIYGFGMGCGPTDEDGENTFQMILWSQGGSIFDKAGNVVIRQSKEAKNMLAKYKELFDSKSIPPAAVTWSPSGNNKSYLTGESAMVFNAPTLYNALKNDPNYQDLFSNTIVMAPPNGTKGNIVLGFPAGWSIMKNSKNITRAKEFIIYMYQDNWYNKYMETVAPVFAPVFEDCAEMPFYKTGVNKQILDYVKNASGYYGYPTETYRGLALAAKSYFKFPVAKMLNSLVTKNLTVDAAISQLEAEISDTAKTMK